MELHSCLLNDFARVARVYIWGKNKALTRDVILMMRF